MIVLKTYKTGSTALKNQLEQYCIKNSINFTTFNEKASLPSRVLIAMLAMFRIQCISDFKVVFHLFQRGIDAHADLDMCWLGCPDYRKYQFIGIDRNWRDMMLSQYNMLLSRGVIECGYSEFLAVRRFIPSNKFFFRSRCRARLQRLKISRYRYEDLNEFNQFMETSLGFVFDQEARANDHPKLFTAKDLLPHHLEVMDEINSRL